MILVASCSCLCRIRWSLVLGREWKCSWSSADRRCSNHICVINKIVVDQGAIYIRCLTVRASILGHHWFRLRPMACFVRKQYLDQCWLIVGNVLDTEKTFRWNMNQIEQISYAKMTTRSSLNSLAGKRLVWYFSENYNAFGTNHVWNIWNKTRIVCMIIIKHFIYCSSQTPLVKVTNCFCPL